MRRLPERRPARLRVAAVLVLLLTSVFAAAALAASPPAYADGAVATADPCGTLNIALRPACYAARAAGDAASWVAGAPAAIAGGVTSSVVGGATSSAFSALTRFVVDGATWFLGQVAGAVTGSTTVSVTSGWFTAHYRAMAGIAAAFALLFLLLSIVATVFHQDPKRLGRAVTAVAVAGIGTAAATTVAQLLLTVSDQLSAAVAASLSGDLGHALTGAARGLGTLGLVTGSGPSVPAFAALLAGLVAALAAVVIWIELLLRDVAIYATLLFFPIALAALAWEASRHWARRLAELLTALIFAKFIIVAVLSLAAGGLAAGRQGYAGVLSGAAMLLVAAFSPFLLLRIIGVFEAAAAAGALDGARQRGTRPLFYGAQSALYAVQRHQALSAQRSAGLTIAAAAPWAAAGTVANAAAKTARNAATGTTQAMTETTRRAEAPPTSQTAKGA